MKGTGKSTGREDEAVLKKDERNRDERMRLRSSTWRKDETTHGTRTGNQEDKLGSGEGPDWWETRWGKWAACNAGATANTGGNVRVKSSGRNDGLKEAEGTK
jgi:hypothetical protein